MLAVQRPMMGSSRQPHMMFGYDPTHSLYHIPSPPPPAPGPSLLDDTDTSFLNSFFDGVGSDSFLNEAADGWQYDWQDLPPDFVGTTSSFGQQIEPITNNVPQLTFPEFKDHFGLVPDALVNNHHSDDVLAAASVLQNGNHNHGLADGHVFSPPAHHQPQQTMAPSMPHISPVAEHPMRTMSLAETGVSPVRRMANKPEDYMRHASLVEAIYQPAYEQSQPMMGNKKVEIKWGTDSGFTGEKFIAPPNTIPDNEIHEQFESYLVCLGTPETSQSTRSSTPVASALNRRRTDDGEDAKARKRRKNGIKEELDEDTASSAGKMSRKRRPKSLGGDGTPAHKRRKSVGSAQPKTARENLTEDQKRENHIKSEQKRRTLIKEGFDDLNELVPDLRGGGFSKSAILIMAADWLEDLLNGNKQLRHQLSILEGHGAV